MRAVVRSILLAVFIGWAAAGTAACGGGSSPPKVLSRWKYDATSEVAPPGTGPERRVLIALSGGQGSVATVNEENGRAVEGPFMPLFPTSHAPVVAASNIIIVTSIGKLVAINFAGAQIYAKPDGSPLGVTGPLQVAPDGSLRIGSTAGHIYGFAASDGSALFDAPVPGPVSTPLAIAGDGTAYAATADGHVIGVDSSGAMVFQQTVKPPAAGPSVSSGGKIAVGAEDAVVVFDKSGAMAFSHPREARVTGTLFLDGGEVIAWGEDGVFEVLSATGEVIGTFVAGPPIYANAVLTKGGHFGVIDNMGVAHLVDRTGKELAKTALPASPLPDVVVGKTTGYAFVAGGKSIFALDFNATD
jgi:outer membrane protein assembly factor BamB